LIRNLRLYTDIKDLDVKNMYFFIKSCKNETGKTCKLAIKSLSANLFRFGIKMDDF